MIKTFKLLGFVALVIAGASVYGQKKSGMLGTGLLERYTRYFNSLDSEDVKNFIPNAQAASWITANAPLFECPDSAIEKIYYYRWWTFRKHLKETPAGFIFTEFITPVNHAGKFNAISCALGHHIYEGRWLHDQQYIDQYINFWVLKDKTFPAPRFHAFSSWVDDAIYNRYLVNQDKNFVAGLVPELDADYRKWESEKQLPSGMFWQFDVRDGMEESVSGSRKVKNRRPSINSYMYGNAVALAKMASMTNNDSLRKVYERKAAMLKTMIVDSLWSDSASFFLALKEDGNLAPREAIGFIPWYFNLPADKSVYAKAWDQIIDTAGFNAPWGLTTAERREPTFRTRGSGHGCEWDGAVWPFATTQTLKGLSNLLSNYSKQGKMSAKVFYDELLKYAMSHVMNGRTYIGEYQDEKNGNWLKGDNPRSRFYNHSGFCDLVISDLVGLKPRADDILELHPLIPEGQWDWFCLDNVLYHGKKLTILWDKTGKKYGKGKGLKVFADGKEVISSAKLKAVRGKL
ncbi:MGH1-like glycoside hydrolase domain-containing protein [Arcticibacter tournemirensis]